MSIRNKDIIKKILLCAITFLSYYLGISLTVHSLSLFQTFIGPAFLPYALVAVAALVMALNFVNAFLSQRFSSSNLFISTTVALAFLFGGSFFLSDQSWQIIAYFLLTGFLYFFLDIQIVNYANSLITPLQAKTYLPLIAGFNSLAIIVGSLFVTQFQQIHEMIGIGLLPGGFLLVIAVLVAVTSYIFRKDLKKGKEEETESESVFEGLKQSYRYISRKSNLFRGFAIAFFLIIALKILTEFKIKTELGLSFTGEQLTWMFGFLYLVESISTFTINLFISKRLLFRFGVGNLLLIFPSVLLVYLVIAFISGLSTNSVMLYYWMFAIPFYSFIPVALTQVFAITPKKYSQSIYFLIRGVLGALSALLVSVSLLIYTSNINLERPLNTGIIILILACSVILFARLKKNFFANLKDNLFKKDEYLKLRSIELLAEKNNREKGEIYLRKLLKAEHNPDVVTVSAMNSLGIIGNYQSISTLIKKINAEEPKESLAAIQAINQIVRSRRKLNKYPITKHLLLRKYEELFIQNVPLYVKLEVISALRNFDIEDIIVFLEQQLSSDDDEIRQNVIDTLGYFNDRGTITYLEPLLEDENTSIIGSAISSLWKFEDIRPGLIPKMIKIIVSDDPESIHAALNLIGRINAHWEDKYVLEKLKDGDPQIRRHALITLINLGNEKYIEKLIQDLLLLVKSEQMKEIDFVLAAYRNFNKKVQKATIRYIQQLPVEDVKQFYKAFSESRYAFNEEISALS